MVIVATLIYGTFVRQPLPDDRPTDFCGTIIHWVTIDPPRVYWSEERGARSRQTDVDTAFARRLHARWTELDSISFHFNCD